MPPTLEPWRRQEIPPFCELVAPLGKVMGQITPLASRGNRPLQMTFEDQLHALIYFHLEDYSSGRHLLQALKQDERACLCVYARRQGPAYRSGGRHRKEQLF